MIAPFSRRFAARNSAALPSRTAPPFFSSQNAKLPRLARVVLAAWLSPLAFSLGAVLAASPANAQTAILEGQAPPPPPSPTVVLDFSVPAKVDSVVGRKAADALAVELANSGNFTVKSRQQVEEAVASRSGLTPPYNTATQANLARAVGARTVFSGRVVGVDVTPGKMARVTIDVRQLEASTEDYINGTVISEISEVKLQNAPSEVLVDEAINKAAVSAVRSLRQTLLPRGTILNVNSDGVATLDIGSRNGVQSGQRFTLLRDVYNKARDFTERVKVGEVRITETEADQAYARLSAGGGSGMTTGDYVRRIYEFSNIPVTAAGDGSTSQTPVTAPVSGLGASGAGGRSRRGFLKRGVYGIAGLVAAVALFGFGGGGSGDGGGTDSPEDVTAYRNIPGDPSRGPTNSNQFTGNILVTWTSGASGITTEASNITGYFVYRAQGGPPNTSNPNNLQGFVTGNTRVFSDNGTTVLTRQVTINVSGTPGDGGPSYQATNAIVAAGPLPALTPDTDTITATLIQNLPLSGNSYFYAVQRATVVEQTTTGGTATNPTTTITRLLQLSNPSSSSGRVTAIAGPRVNAAASSFNINNLQISVAGSTNIGTTTLPGATPLPTSTPVPGMTPTPGTIQFVLPLYNEITEFQVQVSADASFRKGSYTAPTIAKPSALDANGNFLLVVGQPISVPNYDPNSTTGNSPLFVRVGARNILDEPRRRTPFVFGPTTSFTPTGTGTTTLSVRANFLPSNSNGVRQGEALGLPGTSSGIRRGHGGGSGLSSIRRPH